VVNIFLNVVINKNRQKMGYFGQNNTKNGKFWSKIGKKWEILVKKWKKMGNFGEK